MRLIIGLEHRDNLPTSVKHQPSASSNGPNHRQQLSFSERLYSATHTIHLYFSLSTLPPLAPNGSHRQVSLLDQLHLHLTAESTERSLGGSSAYAAQKILQNMEDLLAQEQTTHKQLIAQLAAKDQPIEQVLNVLAQYVRKA